MDRQHARITRFARPASRLAVALLFAAATLLPASAGASSSAEEPEWEREMAVEATCLDWQKVRRCADAAGDLQYECAAKSPFARFWAMLRGDDRKQDDEVRVIEVRKAPSEDGQVETTRRTEIRSAAANGEPAGSGKGTHGGTSSGSADKVKVERKSETKRVVRHGDLPRCSDSR